MLKLSSRDERHYVHLREVPHPTHRITPKHTPFEIFVLAGGGNPLTIELLGKIVHDDRAIGIITALDTKFLYGDRVFEVYRACGSNYDRFLYHLEFELPCQVCGGFIQALINGPILKDRDLVRHLEMRSFGSPGAMWALESPPESRSYNYPIVP